MGSEDIALEELASEFSSRILSVFHSCYLYNTDEYSGIVRA